MAAVEILAARGAANPARPADIPEKPLTYRRDIDGLRCIAVVSVVLYHAGARFVPGGYVGVDIFFVISGYLITSILYSDIEHRRFSLIKFYDRRIRRIFPALFTMIAMTGVAAWLLLMPVDFKEYGESLVAMSVFASNIYFRLNSGYFDETSALRPLVHTWSLAVEEQYYILFPLILFAAHRLHKRSVPYIVSIIGVASFAASIYELHRDATAAFYLPFYRSWELFAGSFVALRIAPYPARPWVRASPWIRECVAAAGLILLVLPIFLYTDRTLFPGEAALPPVLGAALLIWTGEGATTRIGRLLSLRPLVFVGLVSYSLYLWHWPLFVFARYLDAGSLPQLEGLALAAVAFGFAVLSWRFVERPFRRSRSRGVFPIFAAAAGCMVISIGVGFAARLGDGLPWRLPDDVGRIGMVAFDVDTNFRRKCDGLSPSRLGNDGACIIGAPGAPITFAVIGDSFGLASMPAIDAMARETGRRGYIMTKGGCVPLAGVNESQTSCRPFIDASLALVARHPEITAVLIVGRWSTVAEASRFGADTISDMFVSDDETKRPGYEENPKVLERGLERMLIALRSRHVFITAFIPEQAVNVPREMALNRYFGIARDLSVARPLFDQRQRFVHTVLTDLHQRQDFTVIDFGAKLCDDRECAASVNGLPLYVDDNHLSRHTMIALKFLFKPVFAP